MDTVCHDAADHLDTALPRLHLPPADAARTQAPPDAGRCDGGGARNACWPGPAVAGVDAWTLMRVLDEIDYGVMLVDGDARVQYANRMALQQCGSQHALQLDDGRVRTRGAPDHAPFHRALAASTQGRRSLLNVAVGDTIVSVAVVPLATAPLPARTLLVMGKREACPTLSVDFYARAHQLTAAESAVLKGLCSGLRPMQIAADGGVAISTVRTQIGAIRAKTGTSGIRELVERVAALPPIAALPHQPRRDLRQAQAPAA